MGINQWFISNWQWVITFILLVTSVGLGIRSQVFQIRTGIRESLEQLDEEVISGVVIKPILHDFRYFPPSRGVTLLLQGKRRMDVAGIREPFNMELWFDHIDVDMDLFVRINGVNSASFNEEGRSLKVDCATLDDIAIRRITLEIVDTIRGKLKEHNSEKNQ